MSDEACDKLKEEVANIIAIAKITIKKLCPEDVGLNNVHESNCFAGLFNADECKRCWLESLSKSKDGTTNG